MNRFGMGATRWLASVNVVGGVMARTQRPAPVVLGTPPWLLAASRLSPPRRLRWRDLTPDLESWLTRLNQVASTIDRARRSVTGELASPPTSLGGDRLPAAQRESFRLLALNVATLAGHRHLKTLLVMGAYAGDGRTFTVANLGLTLAGQGYRVLLIDADGRRPTLWRHFLTEKPAGWYEPGMPTHPPQIMPTAIPGLYLAATTPAVDSGANPFALSDILAEVRPQFDLIIVDTPACLRFADAFLYAPLSDGVLYVVRRRPQDVSAQRTVQSQLGRLGVETLGVIFNEG